MLQTLLADRFKLATHREVKETSVLSLMLGKNGPKLEKAKGGVGSGIQAVPVNGPQGILRVVGQSMTMHHHGPFALKSSHPKKRVQLKVGLKVSALNAAVGSRRRRL